MWTRASTVLTSRQSNYPLTKKYFMYQIWQRYFRISPLTHKGPLSSTFQVLVCQPCSQVVPTSNFCNIANMEGGGLGDLVTCGDIRKTEGRHMEAEPNPNISVLHPPVPSIMGWMVQIQQGSIKTVCCSQCTQPLQLKSHNREDTINRKPRNIFVHSTLAFWAHSMILHLYKQ